ncbi:radical SAM protein [Massilia rubra]|uniref:Radical SAM protein n=1 Tax=Massilia rubra TaxID=2607910 RepID=A0ABX0M3H0_9BURK|nr:radical SAM protein [Massilia rubra]NHZ36786.1 radical SAM protein [Massilia rubra]
MSPIDCLVIGNNQMGFGDYVASVAAMGKSSGAYRDLRWSYYEDGAGIVSCRDYVNRRQPAGRPDIGYDNILSATITYLATFLQRRGFSSAYINMFQEGKAELASLLRSGRVASVAITTTYYVSPLPLLEVVQFVRSVNPDVCIVVGGPFVDTQHKILSASSLRYLLAQIGANVYIVSSQGESTLVRVLRALRGAADFDSIPNLVFRKGESYVSTPLIQENNPLEDNLVDWSLFAPPADGKQRYMVMSRTARSCPFACSFCSFPQHAGAYKYLQPADVWRELDAIEALGGINSVTFIDDTFNVPPSRFEEILQGIKERHYSFKWNCNFRCQYATSGMTALMKEAGCEGVFLGLESGSNPVLLNMNKRVTAEQYLTGIAHLRDAGILTYASFIVGFPGETDDTVKETMRFIETAKPDFFRAQLWYYDMTTPIHRDAAKYDLKNSQFEWSHRTMNAKKAADWVDRLHNDVLASTWLPQNDFDFPSLFCLLSQGWELKDIKKIVGDFNRRVQDDVALPGASSGMAYADPRLLADAMFGFDDHVEN